MGTGIQERRREQREAQEAFAAIAEPRRRQILDLLAQEEMPVNDLVAALRLAQPQVSKHLRVLRAAGLVSVRSAGRQRFYRVSAESLRPVHSWLMTYERFWTESYERLDEYLEEMKKLRKESGR